MKKTGNGKGVKLIFLVIFIAIIAGIYYLGRGRVQQNRENAYKVEKLQKRDISDYYSFSGMVEAKSRESIMAREMIQITDILYKEGDRVKVDDVLFKTKRKKEIESPIIGEITKIYVRENEEVSPGTKLIDIVDYEDLSIGVKIDEYDLANIAVGKTVKIEIPSIKKNMDGEIEEISREAKNMNGVAYFDGRINIESDEKIRVGMNAEAMILNNIMSGVDSISMEAVQFTGDNKSYVFIKDEEGKAIRRDIEVGINDGTYIEIKDGIEKDEEIMIPIRDEDIKTDMRPPFARGRE